MTAMNKQSNTYTILYIIILVVISGAALAYAAMSLKPRQQANADADKMKQILASVHVAAQPGDDVVSLFDKYITDSYVINDKGEVLEGVKAFDVNVAQEYRQTDIAKRQLPVYVASLEEGDTKYILPMYGAGLWGPIWGYIAIDSDGSTVYGAYFSHSGETPGLGAEITKPEFQDQFVDKQLFVNGQFEPIRVLKHGMAPKDSPNEVDGVSGGTITSKGVGAMIDNCIAPYRTYLETISKK